MFENYGAESICEVISGRNGQKETEKGFQKKVLLKKAGLKTEKKSWNKEKNEPMSPRG